MDAPSEPARLSPRVAVLVALLALVVRVGYELHLHADDGPVGRMGTAIMGDERAYDALARDFADDGAQRTRAFYQEPMYAWLVGLAYRIAPPSPPPYEAPSIVLPSGVHTTIFWLQHVFGVATAVLVAALGMRAGGARVGLIAGLLAALSGPLVFHEAMLLKSSAGLLVFTATLLLWTTAWRDGGRARAAALGLLTGLGILLRGNMYLLLPFVCLSLALRRDERGRGAALVDGVVCGLAALLPLVPVTLHNLALGDRVLTTYQSGTNALIGMPDDDSVRTAIAYQPLEAGRGDALYEEIDAVTLAERLAGRALKSHEVSATLWDEWRRRVGERPGTAVLRAVAKAASTFHGDEVPDVKDWQFFRLTIGWLGTPLSDFHLVGPLALLGVFVALRSRRGGSDGRRARLVVLAGLAVVVVTLALFYVMGRYRLSAAPCLWVLAALAVDAGWRRWTSGARALPAALGLVVLAFGVTTWTGRLTIRPDVRGAQSWQVSWSNDASVSAHQARVATDAAEAERHRDLAVAAARRSLELAPLFPSAHATLVRALDLETDVLEPRSGEALEAAWRMLLVMEGARTGVDVGDPLAAPLGDVQRATVALRQTPSRPGGDGYAGRSLAFAARRVAQDLRAGDELPFAVALLDASLAFDPGEPLAWAQRGQVMRRLGQPNEALANYRRAEAEGVDTAELHNNLGNLLLDLARPAEALPHFERALELLPGNPVILRNIDRARAAIGG